MGAEGNEGEDGRNEYFQIELSGFHHGTIWPHCVDRYASSKPNRSHTRKLNSLSVSAPVSPFPPENATTWDYPGMTVCPRPAMPQPGTILGWLYAPDLPCHNLELSWDDSMPQTYHATTWDYPGMTLCPRPVMPQPGTILRWPYDQDLPCHNLGISWDVSIHVSICSPRILPYPKTILGWPYADP